MEANQTAATRQIIVTYTDTTKQITSTATTLGELKSELESARMHYPDNAQFIVANTASLLINDDAILPETVMHRGEPTRNLVIIIKDSNKKIESGASRVSLITELMDYGVVDDIENHYQMCLSLIETEQIESYLNMLEENAEVGTTNSSADNTAILCDIRLSVSNIERHICGGTSGSMALVGTGYDADEVNDMIQSFND